ncbi:CaiB/BaiF CoA transferase family protein [Neoroseomonas oryzicola]|uniref:CoA transferase n=1 Tax=Neoroseomonas oryzicola TaxID=535904 RepID=A0A9X9WBX3_9PROT|nr:CaiB/BaiF CoA-transferase family protein [Neoroseomonas oryzicola]MBR0657833.1 CoA transferase [Neoroseomonas oryzicola]NKE18599.1 CoA transferase [Neoroseomonas oryzicola]
MPGPLAGLRVIEMAGIGPGPFCCTLLADLGADVLRIDRPEGPPGHPGDVFSRSRRSLALDLKSPASVEAVLRLVERADVLVEGFRPGVMERLGLGPEACHARNPRLVFGRMTGWGQDGPLAQAAGHDIDYIALSGALWSIGRAGQRPVPPLNLIGDFGGGGMLLAFGIMAAVFEATRRGRGQVVDAAMTDGSATLMGFIYGLMAQGRWRNAREGNFLDGACPYYDTYECADGKFVAVGALEPQFFALLLKGLGLDPARYAYRTDPARWPAIRADFAEVFARHPRDHWAQVFEGTDACVAPVLDLEEAPRHPHNVARGTFIEGPAGMQPAPSPRFSRTPAPSPGPAALRGADGAAALRDWGFSAEEIAALLPG